LNLLNRYIETRTERLSREVDNPQAADVFFFKVLPKAGPDADTLRQLIKGHTSAFGEEVDVFDGNEHSYVELGGWLGDQGAALALIGLGTQLGLWRLLSPKTMLGEHLTDELEQQLAGQGLISLQAPKVA
jgi:hypothetical protein